MPLKNYQGNLILIIGNSGSGKDSIISGAIKQHPSLFKNFYIPQRYITRPVSKNESNISISVEEFDQLKNKGDFVLHWNSYELNYGIHIDIDKKLQTNENVIVNVSRTVINQAKQEYKNLKVIFVEVPFEVTAQRVKARGREDGELLEQRLRRAKDNQHFPDADFVVDNSGNLDNAINQFTSFLSNI